MNLYTSRWQNREVEHLDLMPVGISRGVPKFPVRYRYRRIGELEPDGWMFSIKSDARFEEVYRRKLERFGAERIAELLRRVSDEEGGADLALLCYENVHAGEVCHRRMFARWWQERTGQHIEELRGKDERRRAAQEALF